MAISITGEKDYDVTIISNTFIDHFMPHANGAYVKVYLYLLRALARPQTELSISSIADFLGDTEGDVLRAISYLEKNGLLQTSHSPEGGINGIRICDPAVGQTVSADAAAMTDMSAMTAAEQMAGASVISEYAAAGNVSIENVAAFPADSRSAAGAPDGLTGDLTDHGAGALGKTSRLEIPTYSKSQIKALSSNEEVKWIMSIAERYLERLLNPTDIQLIIYLYESVGFPADLILYLYEYCASKEKKNPSYIEAVALSWAEQGIRTVEAAEDASLKYNTNYNAVVKAFGLNRMPGTAEQHYIDRWTGHSSGHFGFSTDIIEEACSRSLLATGRPDFKYTDKILENWHRKGIRTKQDIQKADQIHSQNAARTTYTGGQKAGANNRFNAFPQRNYSGEDYSSMEQKLLNRQG